jgi:hypothetical protein
MLNITDAVATPGRTLPYPAQIISFLAAIVGFSGTAYIGVTEYFRTAELDVILTKDCFYRLID